MTKETRLTYLLLVGCLLLICISAYLIISQAQSLSRARDELQSTKQELAQRQAQLFVLSDALIATEDQANAVDQVSGKVQSICSRQRNTNAEVRALCALSGWATGHSGRFLAAYAATAAQRASATSLAEWKAVRAEYAGLRGLLTAELDPRHLWAARVEEGVAYSDYRLGQLDEASAAADRAFQFDDRSAFVGLTRLKIACSKKEPKDRIAELYSAHRRNLEESVRNPIPPMDKRYAGYELSYFDRDAEVRLVCAYANLSALS